MIDLEVVVAVPRLAGAVPELHEADAALDQPASDQQLPGLDAGAVHVADVLRFAANVERLGRFGLHAEAELERADAGLQRGIVLPRLQVAIVEPFEQIELLALLGQRQAIVADVFDQLLDGGVLGVDVRAFVDARQKAGLPVLRFLDRVAERAHRDERRQVLVFAAEAVAEPGAEAGANLAGVAAVHQEQRRFVAGDVGVHRADHGDVVDRLGGATEDVADLDAALAVLVEFERRGEGGAGLALGRECAAGQQLAGIFVEHRFGIERVDVRRAAVHEDVDDALGFGGEVGRVRAERIGRGGGRFLGAHDQVAECERAEAHAAAVEQFAAG